MTDTMTGEQQRIAKAQRKLESLEGALEDLCEAYRAAEDRRSWARSHLQDHEQVLADIEEQVLVLAARVEEGREWVARERTRSEEPDPEAEHEDRAERKRDAWRPQNRGRLRTHEDLERELWREMHTDDIRYERVSMEPDLGPEGDC